MKKIASLILLALITFQVAGQKRTSVKGYYRKDGTYVRPHTRTTSSHYSSGSYSASAKQTEVDIVPTTLKTEVTAKGDYLRTTASSRYYKGDKIIPTQLTQLINENENSQDTLAAVIYVSVLRYNGLTIDICPVTRGILGDWEFSKIYHRFSTNRISKEDALDLLANYNWKAKEDEMSKDFSYSFNDKGMPKYLTKTIEAIKLK